MKNDDTQQNPLEERIRNLEHFQQKLEGYKEGLTSTFNTFKQIATALGAVIALLLGILGYKITKLKGDLDAVEASIPKMGERTAQIGKEIESLSKQIGVLRLQLASTQEDIDRIRPDATGKITSPLPNSGVINRFEVSTTIKSPSKHKSYYVAYEFGRKFFPKYLVPRTSATYTRQCDKGDIPQNKRFSLCLFELDSIQAAAVESWINAGSSDGMIVSGNLLDRVEISTSPIDTYHVYSDRGIPQGDIWTWSGEDFYLPKPELINAGFSKIKAPEGMNCFAITSGKGDNNYAGWGVFLGIFNKKHELEVSHTMDLTPYRELLFKVKSPVDLKVEIQQGDHKGRKSYPQYISDYGWSRDGSGSFQEIKIPTGKFSSVDLSKVFCPFMITGTGGSVSYYVDDVKWTP